MEPYATDVVVGEAGDATASAVWGASGIGDLLPLLDAALRSRVSTASGLAEMTGIPLAEIDRQLGVLEGLGFVSMAADEISYRRPDAAAAALTEQLVVGLVPQISEVFARAQGALASIPGLLQAWDPRGRQRRASSAGGCAARAVGAGGHVAAPVLPPRPADHGGVHAEHGGAVATDQEDQASFWADRSDQSVDVRLLMSVADATHPAGRDRIQGELDSGVQIRSAREPAELLLGDRQRHRRAAADVG